MELLNGDERNPNGADFPRHISPFPATDGLLVPSSAALLHSSDIEQQNLPPQKLRPIRASGRSPSSSQANDLPPVGALDGTLEKFGILVDQVCGINSASSEYFAPPVKAEGSDFGVHGFGDSGLQSLVAGCSALIGSGTSGENGRPDEGGLFDDETSSSSGDDESSGTKETTNRKRKRKTRKKIEKFVQRLVTQVMDKQEEMHRQLIETLERRERERVTREEAWKQQERERIQREEALRVQENARSLALISFIENVMGHKVETPQSFTANDFENHNSNVSFQNSDSNNKRWPEAEAQALVIVRASMEQKFRGFGGKYSNLWEEIASKMQSMGYNRSAKKCREKWENMNKYYRRSVGSGGGKKRHENGKSCSYFHELHVLYKNGVVNPGTASEQADIKDETKSSNLLGSSELG